ncbi:hypothetical protein [Paraburkholderia sp. RL18-085-BIA-A]|uniref:hypothetical protein n=1 Tax=Paraburkholderia sp. RL18-085-BIA-A TaxID=3031633 RepID=UPI0038B86621
MNAQSIIIAGLIKVLFLLAFFGITRFVLSAKGSARNPLWPGILSFAYFLTSFMTLGAAFYQFGVACCERHDTMRQCFIFIGLASSGAALGACAQGKTEHGGLRTRYVFFLLFAVLIPTVIAVPDIASDYGNYRRIQDAKIANWNAGMAPGSSMVYVQRPLGKIVGGFSVPDGTYTKATEGPALAKWIAHFFKKDQVTFVTEP